MIITGDWSSKSRTLSDQPATCPLCGAIIRQSRNLRRHLELLHFGGKQALRVKKDHLDRSVSKASIVLKSSQKPDVSSYPSSMPSLNYSSTVSSNTGTSNISVPGNNSVLAFYKLKKF